MTAELNSPQANAHRPRSEPRHSPPRAERHRDSDRVINRSNSFRERNPEDSLPQALDREADRGLLESDDLRRHSQTALASTVPTHADPIDSYQNIQVPNQSKIYIGGLPEFTRPEDLNDCFSQLGRIWNVELKSGYGFVEYDNPQSACDAVAKYHEGTFLGSQIKVEISHGGSRPRHVAVSNNPEACYTCGVAGHWARDCPDADNQIYHKRRLKPRSRSPPRGREDGYIHRDSRQPLEPMHHEHHARRRSPLGQIDCIRDGPKSLALAPRERYHLPAYADGKRYRPDYAFHDRERDQQRELDPKLLPHQHHRDSYRMPPSFSRTPPLAARDYLSERSRFPDPYLSQSLRGRDSQNDWPHEMKSSASKPHYQRNVDRTYEPARLGGYNDRSYMDQRVSYPGDRMASSNPIDARYDMPDGRFSRGDSRRLRSPRRSLSPPRRGPINHRNSFRAQSPPGSRIGPYSAHASYSRNSYPMRK